MMISDFFLHNVINNVFTITHVFNKLAQVYLYISVLICFYATDVKTKIFFKKKPILSNIF